MADQDINFIYFQRKEQKWNSNHGKNLSMYESRKSKFLQSSSLFQSRAKPNYYSSFFNLLKIHSQFNLFFYLSAFSPDKKIADVYSEGAGFINFPEALDPGLVNACDDKEFVNFLVGQGYKKKSLRKIFEWNGDKTKAIKASELNYPSLTEYCSTKD